MIVGIDASNIGSGGTKTHFRKILEEGDPPRHGVERVIVWGDRATLDLAPTRPWLRRVHEPELEGGLLARLAWQRRRLSERAREGCDLLFSPGGLVTTSFRPVVTMSRNMLPFAPEELRRYGLSPMRLRLAMLRFGQSRSLRRAAGAIFLTQHALEQVGSVAKPTGRVAVIPHGVDERFRAAPRPQRPIGEYSMSGPFRILYISTVDAYKHQEVLAESVAALRGTGLPLALELVGGAYGPSLRSLKAKLRQLDPEGRFLHFRGPVPFEDLPGCHADAQLFAFPSTCENMPNILVEAMAAGHPIACSRARPMPDILGDGGQYFEAESADSVAAALRALIENPDLRARLAARAHELAAEFSWRRCADETFAFIAQVGSAPSASEAQVALESSSAGARVIEKTAPEASRSKS